ncbi:MAG: sugar phosphate isomerase/epimerase family protein [Clostridia bacterium]|jgi:sugar phosphate isomerase/epimerase
MKKTAWEIGISSTCKKSIHRFVFDEYAKNNVFNMEISLPYTEYDHIDWSATKQASKDTGVRLWSIHLPFSPFEINNLASPDIQIRKSTLKMHSELIKKAGDIGINIAVVHPSGEPNNPDQREELLKHSTESLSILAKEGAKAGVTIAVENLPRTCLGNCSDEIITLISSDDRLRICFDTNHLLIQKNTDFIKLLGDKIITIHVSDYDFLNERHWLPYEGKNNWIEIVTLLEKANYSGPFMYEVPLEAPPTIQRRALTLQDFVENFKACIEKRVPEVIGVPNIEACKERAYFQTAKIEA